MKQFFFLIECNFKNFEYRDLKLTDILAQFIFQNIMKNICLFIGILNYLNLISVND